MSELTGSPAPSLAADSVVLKFGGTSLADVAAFERVAAIVRQAQRAARPVIVASALSGATDVLLAATAHAEQGDPAVAAQRLDPLLERHAAIARQLVAREAAAPLLAELDRARRDIAQLLDRAARGGGQQPALQDEIASYGEWLSTSLLAAVLAAAGLPARSIDARRCIVTDDIHGRASPLFPATERQARAEIAPVVAGGLIPVMGGFIGATPNGVTTTLGRGGSDYTAALVGAALGVREIQIWTDVSGVLTADPRVVRAARTIPSLSYAEAAELAYFGAKVLHPKAIQPAMERGIPVRILNSHQPDAAGTLVTAQGEVWPGAVKAIAHKSGVTVLQVTSARMLGAYGFLRALFEVFDRYHTVVDVVTTSEVSVSLTLEDARALSPIATELGALGEVSVETGRAIVCIVGEGLRATPGIAARVFATLRDINVSLISQGASRVNLTFVVDEARVGDAVRGLHEALCERPPTPTGAAARSAGIA